MSNLLISNLWKVPVSSILVITFLLTSCTSPLSAQAVLPATAQLPGAPAAKPSSTPKSAGPTASVSTAAAQKTGIESTHKVNVTYPIVDTGQGKCYDNHAEIPCAQSNFPGQDAEYSGNIPSYTPGANGLTVYDNISGLTWQHSPDTNADNLLDKSDKLTLAQSQALPAKLNAARFGGYTDWRLPTIKELFSLIDFRGTDPSGAGGSQSLIPFIDTTYFQFAYGDAKAGERTIDSQYASSTVYVNKSFPGAGKLFGVNFADGRIKGYDLSMPDGTEKTFFVICVRGNPAYGKNSFVDNGDQTITDQATGLTWAKADSGSAMNWQESLAWVQTQNAANYLGHNDWRLPDIKELQSIVDYSRSPDTTSSAAIDPLFHSTQITNEAGQADYPFYWSSTTHASSNGQAETADYMAFGRALGYMNNAWVDVHGAGAQRSDPKSGDASKFPQGRGPQGDAIRIKNYGRLVRGGNVVAAPAGEPASTRPSMTVDVTSLQNNQTGGGARPTQGGGQPGGPGGTPPPAARAQPASSTRRSGW